MKYSTERAERLRTGNIPRLLLVFSLPAIIGMLTQAAYYVVDRIFIGRWGGTEAIAGVAVCAPFMQIQLAFGMLLGIGSGAVVSIRLGERKPDQAEQVLATVTLLLLIVSALLSIATLVWLDPILRLCAASDAVLPYARAYLQIIAAGTVFQMFSFGLNAVIRAEGNPRVAMTTLLLSVLLNIVLAPLFIFVFHWGMRGAGLATVIAQATSATWVLWYFLRGKSLLKIRAANLWLNPRVVRAIATIGSPQFAMQVATGVMYSLSNRQAGRYGGDVAISVMGIIYPLMLMVAMPVFGLNQGTQPIIGFNYGARQFDRVKQALLTAILAATCVTVLGFLIAMIFPLQLVHMFDRGNAQLAELGVHAIRIAMLMFPVIGFQVISTAYFMAVGKPKVALILGLSRQVLILIPFLLIFPLWFHLNGVWVALPAADFLSALVTGVCLAFELRHLDQRHIETQPVAVQPETAPSEA